MRLSGLMNPDLGNTMVDKTRTAIDVGLSDEEKADLEKLITGLKQDPSEAQPGASPEELQKQVQSMTENLTQLVEMLLKFDTKIRVLYDIVRLSHQKSDMMNRRIDALIESVKGAKNVSSGSES
jgi:hypothetical protein